MQRQRIGKQNQITAIKSCALNNANNYFALNLDIIHIQLVWLGCDRLPIFDTNLPPWWKSLPTS